MSCASSWPSNSYQHLGPLGFFQERRFLGALEPNLERSLYTSDGAKNRSGFGGLLETQETIKNQEYNA